MNLTQTVDIAGKIDPDQFHKNYFLTQKPLIIKGLTDSKIAGRLWSLSYLKQKMGDLVIDVYDNGNKKSESSAHTTPDLKMKFSEYLSILEKDEPTNLRIFLFNFFKSYPDLQKEFPCPDLFKGMLDSMGYMFFGGKDTTVRIHYDIDVSNILLTHFGGRKKIVLIAPEYSDLLYRLPFNTYSLVNLDKPDYKRHPGLDHVKGYACVLEEGDTLFIPGGYWHYITYLDRSFSISYRKLALTKEARVQGFMNMFIRLPFDKIMNKMLGVGWLFQKEKMASKKAEKAIRKLYKTEMV
jgi:hypothetical protein